MCNCIYEEILPRSLEFYLGVVGAMDLGDDFMKGVEAIEEEGSFEDEDKEEGETKKPKKKSKSRGKKRKGSHCSRD